MTAPSAGVGAATQRIDFCVDWLRKAGYDVVVGDCMDGSGITSGPASARAAELTQMLCDPSIRCLIPPWESRSRAGPPPGPHSRSPLPAGSVDSSPPGEGGAAPIAALGAVETTTGDRVRQLLADRPPGGACGSAMAGLARVGLLAVPPLVLLRPALVLGPCTALPEPPAKHRRRRRSRRRDRPRPT